MTQPFRLRTFLSPQGRIGHSSYFNLAVIAGLTSVSFGFRGWIQPSPSGWYLFYIAIHLMLIWPRFCVTAKRLHDINLPAAWALIGFLPDVVCLVLALLLSVYPIKTLDVLFHVFFAMFCATAIGLMWLVAVRGDTTENRYGPVPEAERLSKV